MGVTNSDWRAQFCGHVFINLFHFSKDFVTALSLILVSLHSVVGTSILLQHFMSPHQSNKTIEIKREIAGDSL